MFKRIITLTLITIICATTCAAKKLQTKMFHITPPMECSNCEARVAQCIRDEAGVQHVTTDRKAQIVAVTYDADATTAENIIQALTKINYKATESKICTNRECDNYGKECNGTCATCKHPCNSSEANSCNECKNGKH